MSEAWAITIFSTVIASLGWIAIELHNISKELNLFVRRDECRDNMGDQCEELKRLWDESRSLDERLILVEKSSKQIY